MRPQDQCRGLQYPFCRSLTNGWDSPNALPSKELHLQNIHTFSKADSMASSTRGYRELLRVHMELHRYIPNLKVSHYHTQHVGPCIFLSDVLEEQGSSAVYFLSAAVGRPCFICSFESQKSYNFIPINHSFSLVPAKDSDCHWQIMDTQKNVMTFSNVGQNCFNSNLGIGGRG